MGLEHLIKMKDTLFEPGSRHVSKVVGNGVKLKLLDLAPSYRIIYAQIHFLLLLSTFSLGFVQGFVQSNCNEDARMKSLDNLQKE